MGAVALALLFGLPGVLILGLGLFCFFRGRRTGPQVCEDGEGVVVGFTPSDDEGYDIPRVRFTRGGVTVVITGSVASCPTAYTVGQRVPVRYPAGRPDLAVIADFRHQYLFDVSCIGFGVGLVGVAVLLLVLRWFAT